MTPDELMSTVRKQILESLSLEISKPIPNGTYEVQPQKRGLAYLVDVKNNEIRNFRKAV